MSTPSPLLLAIPGADPDLALALAEHLQLPLGQLEARGFPDGETYARLDDPVDGRLVILVGALTDPDRRYLPLRFVAATARDLGAARVGLVSAYLPYMRQDQRFAPGEALTSKLFAGAIGEVFDWLVTVDPHLHRHDGLDALYPIPTTIARSAPAITAWVRDHVDRPLIIGPDEESAQWTRPVARDLDAPCVILSKVRRGDRDVQICGADALRRWRDHTPVIIDDIVSTGQTMLQALERVRDQGLPDPVCVAIHPLFADDDVLDALAHAGARLVASCNTVPHPSNAIDVTAALADAVRPLLTP